MGREIERKFVVDPEKLPPEHRLHHAQLIQQGYLSVDPVVRIRVHHEAEVTYKFGRGMDRVETNAPMDRGTALRILDQLPWKIEKQRRWYGPYHPDGEWVVDRMLGRNAGLWLAEFELYPGIPADAIVGIDVPAWCIQDVTNESRYTNALLAVHPWTTWPANQ